MDKPKSVLFLSGLDFKDKSIQVIRKTPEAYAAAGWEVRYIVARDDSARGNYAYEQPFDPPGVTVHRLRWPLRYARDRVRNRHISLILAKMSGLLAIFQLGIRGRRAIRKSRPDIVYGYEMHGVLAARVARLWIKNAPPLITRFQGTWLSEILDKRQWARLIWNLDQVLAIRTPTSLCIMTDDGTFGDRAYSRLSGQSDTKLRFWSNGVDKPVVTTTRAEILGELGIPTDNLVLVSISRLEGWKRVDRCIAIVGALRALGADASLIVVGGGSLRSALESQAHQLGLKKSVCFVGAVSNDSVANYLNAADFFLSMYDLSNVGNPMLEALASGKPVVTLANGDTGSWIRHGYTGFIYDPMSSTFITDAANDILEAWRDVDKLNRLSTSVAELSQTRTWNWRRRLKAEIDEVTKITDA